jgi:hypothetical protein
VKTLAHLVRGQLRALALIARDDGTAGGDPGQPGDAEQLPDLHERAS